MKRRKKKVSDYQMFDQNGIHKITGTRMVDILVQEKNVMPQVTMKMD